VRVTATSVVSLVLVASVALSVAAGGQEWRVRKPAPDAQPAPGSGDPSVAAETARIRAEQTRLITELEALMREAAVAGRSESEVRQTRLRAETLIRQLSATSARLGMEMGARAATVMTTTSPQLRRALVEMGNNVRVAAPRGWIGLNFDTPMADRLANGDYLVRFLEYPGVVSVDPDSPAEHAGVRLGDTLVALNGIDVLREIAINRVLAPSARVEVRLRRDGSVREVPMTVAETPDRIVALRVASRPPSAVGAPPSPPSRDPRVYRVLAPARPDLVELGAEGVLITRANAVAGARLETITSGLADVLGVRQGVLVTEVAPGSPAQRSGLAAGDIVLAAAGQRVANVAAIADAMKSSNSRSVRLQVVRKGKERTVNLTW
jgi:predicted metalloprotease with PDZ domain